MSPRAAVPSASLLAVLLACGSEAPPADTGLASPVPQADPLPEPDPGVSVSLPDYPWWGQDTLRVDEELLRAQATGWCAAGGGDPRAFLFGWAPRDGFDRLCNPGPGDPDAAAILGEFYVSGWLGGQWFGEVLGYGGGDTGGAGMTEEDFLALADAAGVLVELSAAGSADAVIAANRDAVTATAEGFDVEALMANLFVMSAYNQGYTEAVAASAAGMPEADAFSCAGFLDCDWTEAEVAAYTAFRPALDPLADPPDASWEEVAAAAADAAQWVDIGGMLWNDPGFDEDTTRLLLEVDAGYLLVTHAAALASATGAGAADPSAGRCALLLEAAVDTWNRAYFAGVGAAPTGEPAVTCP